MRLFSIAVVTLALGVSMVNFAPAAIVDVTFGVGALPADQGYTTGGSTDPTVNIDTSAGLWKNNMAAGDSGFFVQHGVPDSITDTLIHGYAEITHHAFSGNRDDQTIIKLMKSGNYFFDLYWVENDYVVRTANGGWGSSTYTSNPVTNNDGAEHVYGWELDITSATLDLYFDQAYLATYNVSTGIGDPSEHYWGDGSGGSAHNEDWDRFVIDSGAIPEPSSVLLLLTGVALLLIRRP
jgi:hypothetical protein